MRYGDGMAEDSGAFQALKARMKATWMAGDFARIAAYSQGAAEEFVGRRTVRPGVRVLDVGCGSGNVSIPLARAGATVTGVDIATNLLDAARERASLEGLTIQFDEGDAEALPYADGAFDLTISMFGAMFAPRPEVVVREMVRVTRSGGEVVMGNWTPTGLVGRTFAATARHVPPLPAGTAPPVAWGDEATVRARFTAAGERVREIACTPAVVRLRYPYSPREVVEFFRAYFGPTQRAFETVPAERREALARDLEEVWVAGNQADDGRTTAVDSEYLDVVVRV